jgi:hypothetical protein
VFSGCQPTTTTTELLFSSLPFSSIPSPKKETNLVRKMDFVRKEREAARAALDKEVEVAERRALNMDKKRLNRAKIMERHNNKMINLVGWSVCLAAFGILLYAVNSARRLYYDKWKDPYERTALRLQGKTGESTGAGGVDATKNDEKQKANDSSLMLSKARRFGGFG